jgi:hypothetical protein
MVNDQRFLGMPPEQQRAALFQLTGDDRFNSLNPGQLLQFTSRLQATPAVLNRPQLPTPAQVTAPLGQGMQPDTTSAFTGNRFTITPQAGESFSDTMNRAAQAGKTVTPQEVSSQAVKGLKESPAVLGAATGIGASMPAMAAGMGELAAPTTQTVTKGAGYLAQQVEQEGPSLLRQGAGAVAKFAAQHKVTTGTVGLFILNKLGIHPMQILDELTGSAAGKSR